VFQDLPSSQLPQHASSWNISMFLKSCVSRLTFLVTPSRGEFMVYFEVLKSHVLGLTFLAAPLHASLWNISRLLESHVFGLTFHATPLTGEFMELLRFLKSRVQGLIFLATPSTCEFTELFEIFKESCFRSYLTRNSLNIRVHRTFCTKKTSIELINGIFISTTIFIILW